MRKKIRYTQQISPNALPELPIAQFAWGKKFGHCSLRILNDGNLL